jgi:alkylation response protein AidB-like acyl-CoA dehydrogenase
MLTPPLSDDLRALRTEFEAWILSNDPRQIAHSTDLNSFIDSGRKWQQRLAAGRWIGSHWPQNHGGRGLTLVEEAFIQELLARHEAPQILGLFGLTMVGPVLIRHGTEDQKSRFLSHILNANHIWCQGFSEPGAGSDLAALRTNARRDDAAGGYYVSGQKVWTSFAQIADYCFCLCRTAAGGKKHEGLTYLLIDMRSPGVQVRPLRQISGDSEFNEVFLDDVFVPDDMRVGAEGQGWDIALSTLMHERVVLTFARHIQSEALLRKLLKSEVCKSEYSARLDSLIIETCAVRALAYKHLFSYSAGVEPGPEGSLDKLFWSESFGRIASLALETATAEVIALTPSSLGGAEQSEALYQYLYSRGRTIAAGTSEIQRNIIAERVLGLPRLQIKSRDAR